MIRYYIVEGETEAAFLTFLKDYHHIAPGKIRIFNLMQKKLSLAQDFLSIRNVELLCIIDTDIVGETNLQCLAANIRQMKKSIPPRHIKLFAQNKNLEDELCRLLSCKTGDLSQKLHCKEQGTKQLKRELAHLPSQKYQILFGTAPLRTYCTCFPQEIRKRLEAENLSAIIAEPGELFSKRK